MQDGWKFSLSELENSVEHPACENILIAKCIFDQVLKKWRDLSEEDPLLCPDDCVESEEEKIASKLVKFQRSDIDSIPFQQQETKVKRTYRVT